MKSLSYQIVENEWKHDVRISYFRFHIWRISKNWRKLKSGEAKYKNFDHYLLRYFNIMEAEIDLQKRKNFVIWMKSWDIWKCMNTWRENFIFPFSFSASGNTFGNFPFLINFHLVYISSVTENRTKRLITIFMSRSLMIFVISFCAFPFKYVAIKVDLTPCSNRVPTSVQFRLQGDLNR